MQVASRLGPEPTRPNVVMTRLFDAPRRIVFEALVEPAHHARWWAPRDVLLSVCEVDLWPGGGYRFLAQSVDGAVSTFTGTYREIVRPERLVYAERADGDAESSRNAVVTMSLAPRGAGTALTLTERLGPKQARGTKARVAIREATAERIDRLAAHLASEGIESVEDGFNAEQVLEAIEDPEAAQPHPRVEGRRRALERFAELFGMHW